MRWETTLASWRWISTSEDLFTGNGECGSQASAFQHTVTGGGDERDGSGIQVGLILHLSWIIADSP